MLILSLLKIRSFPIVPNSFSWNHLDTFPKRELKRRAVWGRTMLILTCTGNLSIFKSRQDKQQADSPASVAGATSG